MARRSRYMGYVNALTKEQVKKSAPSIMGRLSQMKQKAKAVNKKTEED